MCRQYVGGGRRSRMESNAAAGAAGSGFGSSATGIGSSATTPSLKKLKREAAQRRKAQARSLKLRAEEQERLQRLEIDALVEQQRLQRLERQRRKEDAERLAQEASSLGLHHNSSSTSGNEDVKCAGAASTKLKHHHNSGSTNQQVQTSTRSSSQEGLEEIKKAGSPSAWPAPKDHAAMNKASNKQVSSVQQIQQLKQQQQQQQQQQQEQMRALVENRRRLARGPRSGNLMLTITEPSSTTATSNSSVLPLEDHRVVSTEYQAAGTQALMRVTLLAAGFVIGARGISARLIGQITGAIIQSWTESSSSACRSNSSSNHSNNNNSVPIRLFRIQGKKAVVQAAVSLVEQAVAKYKELCECKRRGEFVQREHVINGVEFYYQPPPRKAFAASESVTAGSKSSPPPSSNSSPSTTTSATSPISSSEVPLASSLAFPPHHVWLHHLQQAQQAQQQKQLQAQQAQLLQQKNQQRSESGFAPDMNNPEDASDGVVPVSNRFSSTGTTSTPVPCCSEQQQADQTPSFEQKKLDSLSSSVDGTNANPAVEAPAAPVSSAWMKNANGEQQVLQVESSLFSIFGNGGLPLPIAQDCRAPPNAPFLKSSVSSTPFDFPKYDFFREFLPAFPPQLQHQRDGYNLFAQHQHHHHHFQQVPFMSPLQQQQQQQQDELCIVCVEKPSGTRLLACGHASVCLSCVQGLATCPVCREKIVGWQPALRPPSSGSEMTGASYDLWNLGPCSNQETTTL